MFEIKKFTRNYSPILITGTIFSFLPGFFSPYSMLIFTFSNIYLIAAASFDIFSFTGEYNFGYALFVGVGAYTVAFLSFYLNISPLFGILAGALTSLFTSLFVGLLIRRMSGTYFAISMMALSEITRLVFGKAYDVTRGDDGLPTAPISSHAIVNYYISLGLAMFVVLLIYTFEKSRRGVLLKTIKEDAITSEAIGVDVAKYKQLAFAISALFGGLAGGLFASSQQLADPSKFSLKLTFNIFFISYIGGINTTLGAIVGAYTLFPLTEYLRFFLPGLYRYIFYAIFLVLTIKYVPKGLYGLIEAAYERLRAHIKLE